MSAPILSWVYLGLAGLLEVAWAVGLKLSRGLDLAERPVQTVLTVSAMAASVILLGVAARHLPIGTAYAIWVGIGAAGTAIAGMMMFDEPATLARIAAIAVIVAGVVGLKLAS
ncbi:MAG: multidrug efflux SMR transporter [Elioraea sp.]|nr:multidrug efflux SMR transporter [Elioraea sp.]MDW8444612.1 multidrug efflux SMR transporter [Acetobacteraceae bacterium]